MTDREEAERIVTSSYMLRHTLIDAVAIALSAARAEQREADAQTIMEWPEWMQGREKLAAAIRAGTPAPNQKGGDATNERQRALRPDVAQPRSAELSGEAPAGPRNTFGEQYTTTTPARPIETPAERQAKIVKWLRTKADQPWNIDTPVLQELANAIERGDYEGAEK